MSDSHAARPGPRIGLFGGAFDPPHNAHVALVRAAVAQLRLDRLHLLPTGEAWHKARPLSPAADRLAMARLAFEPEPAVQVDARELARQGPTYTIDTLRELRAQAPAASFWLLIGEDQAQRLDTWREWRAILEIATICVARRPDNTRTSPQFSLEELPAGWPADRFVTLEMPAIDLSSTQIRALAARGDDVSAFVPPAVARYIANHQLYRPTA